MRRIVPVGLVAAFARLITVWLVVSVVARTSRKLQVRVSKNLAIRGDLAYTDVDQARYIKTGTGVGIAAKQSDTE